MRKDNPEIIANNLFLVEKFFELKYFLYTIRFYFVVRYFFRITV